MTHSAYSHDPSRKVVIVESDTRVRLIHWRMHVTTSLDQLHRRHHGTLGLAGTPGTNTVRGKRRPHSRTASVHQSWRCDAKRHHVAGRRHAKCLQVVWPQRMHRDLSWHGAYVGHRLDDFRQPNAVLSAQVPQSRLGVLLHGDHVDSPTVHFTF